MASSVRAIVLIDNDDPINTTAQVAKASAQGQKAASDGYGNEVGIGFVASEVEKISSLNDNAIWICKKQLMELKVSSMSLRFHTEITHQQHRRRGGLMECLSFGFQ